MKKIKYLTSALILMVAFFTYQCKHDPDIIPDDGGNGNGNNPGDTTELNTCDPDTVYFQNDILPLLISNCGTSGCHDPGTASEGVVLTDYFSVINSGKVKPGDPNDSEIFEKITENDPEDRMPPIPADPLSADKIAIIKKWIEQGALNNSCESGCDTTNVTFNNTIWPTIETNCTGCHSGANAGAGIFLTNYNEIVAIANTGQLIGAISHADGFSPMPQNANILSDCKIREIEIWIENGTPNN